MLRYTWTEDGVPEVVTAEDVFIKEETECYHCCQKIDAGSAAMKLLSSDGDVYILHPGCAQKGLSGCGAVIDRLFSWDYEHKTDRAEKVKELTRKGAACVLTDHNWAHENHSLEAYSPVHRQADFVGGLYVPAGVDEYDNSDEANTYHILAGILARGYAVRFHHDSKRNYMFAEKFRWVTKEE